MRGCLFVVVAGVIVLAGAAWFAGPALAASLVRAALTAGGFDGSGTQVTVETDPPLEILTGRADVVRIESRDVRLGEFAAGSLDLTLSEVVLIGPTAGRVRGTIEHATIEVGGALPVTAIVLDGPTDAASAVAHVDGAAATLLLERRLEEMLGSVPGVLSLREPDIVTLGAAGGSVDARLAVQGGALVLRPAFPAGSAVEVVSAQRLAPFAVDAVAVEGGELVLRGTLDIGSLLR